MLNEQQSEPPEARPLTRRERYRRSLQSEILWGSSSCLDRPTPTQSCHDIPTVEAHESDLELSDIDEGYEVSLDVQTGEITILPIVDGVVIENADN